VAKKESLNTPKYRRLKRSDRTDLAFVELNGHRHDLGCYGATESKQAYHRMLTEWLANGRKTPITAHESLTVTELIAAWLRQNAQYHTAKRIDKIKLALRPLKTLYGSTKAREFGPVALKTVRSRFVATGMMRDTVNEFTGIVKQIFRWAVADALIPANVIHGLEAVKGLRRGRTEARESQPRQPVPIEHVEAIKEFVPRAVWGLIELLLYTGARPGELMKLRAVDIATSGSVWTYSPSEHKTAHKGKQRTIMFGPKSQEILKRFMTDRAVTDYIFDPADSEYGNRRAVHSHYNKDSFRRCIRRACELAAVPHWCPYQLRHARASELRRLYGEELTRVVLGHSKLDTTRLYGELDTERARRVMQETG